MKYNIQGEPMPVVICHLEAGESMITERGSMVWMSANMRMETKAGGLGKALGRMFGGESLFQNTYTAEGGPGMIAFASSFPGAIRAVEITPNMPVIAQKSAFLAATPGVELSIHFQKKVGAGFFGGEGFIMQKLSGHGMAFLEIDGSAVEYTLAPGQQIIVDTGNLAMVDATCQIDIQTVRGAKNVLFGGEGLFNTVVTGPGRVVLQTMALPAFASALIPYLPAKSDGRSHSKMDRKRREKTAAFYPERIFFQRYLNFSQTKNSIGGHGENLRIFFVFFLLYTLDLICCLRRGG